MQSTISLSRCGDLISQIMNAMNAVMKAKGHNYHREQYISQF